MLQLSFHVHLLNWRDPIRLSTRFAYVQVYELQIRSIARMKINNRHFPGLLLYNLPMLLKYSVAELLWDKWSRADLSWSGTGAISERPLHSSHNTCFIVTTSLGDTHNAYLIYSECALKYYIRRRKWPPCLWIIPLLCVSSLQMFNRIYVYSIMCLSP